MTLQLAVRITGDASSLTASAREADAAVTDLGGAVQATGAKSATAAQGIKQAADAASAAARSGAAAAVTPPAPPARPSVTPPTPIPAPVAPAAVSAPGPARAPATSVLPQRSPAATVLADVDALHAEALGATAAVDGLGIALQETGARATIAAAGIRAAADASAALRLGAMPAVMPPRPAVPAVPVPPIPAPAAPRPQIVPPAPAPAIPPLPPERRPPEGGFRRDQWMNLGYQGGDILSSGFSGASPLMVLMQQGPQIAQVLADTPGGIAGGLKTVASRAMSILTPVRLVAAGFVGLGATVAALGISWARSQAEIQQGLTGIGQKSRATLADVNAIGASLAVGGRMSSSEGRGIAGRLAAAGNIDVSNIQGVANLAPGYAKLFGKDLDEAGADLARLFSDPAKGADELNARIGGLDAATKAYIRTLVEQGNRQEAIRVTVRAFAPEIEAAAEKTGAWAKAWILAQTAAEAVGRVVAKPFVDGTLQEQLAAAEKVLSGLQYQAEAGGYGDAAGQIPKAQAEVDRLRQRVSDQEAAPGIKAAAERSQAYDAAVKAIRPEIEATETLTNRLKLLTDATGDFDALAAMTPAARQGLIGAIEATKGAIETNISAEDRARKSQELTIRSIEARTAAEKAAIAEEQKRLDLAGASMKADARRVEIEGARAAVMAQSTRDSQDRLRGASATAAAAGLPSYQRRLAELDARTAESDKAAEGNLPAVSNNQKAKALERQAIDMEAIGGPLREADRAIREQVAGLKLQEAAFGASTEAAAKAAAAQQLINQYTADGVPITENLRRAIEARAAALGKATADQEASLRRQREIVGGLDDIRGSARGGLTGIFSDLSKGRSPVDGIVSSLDSMSSRIFDRTVSTPLVNTLIGQEGKAGGGLFGDAVSSIFGKTQAVSTAEINAGVVNLSGAIAGLTGATAGAGPAGAVASALAGKGGSSAEAASGILSKLSGSRSEVADYVRQAAAARGIDPNVATRVVNQESGFNVAATNLTAKEQSYGVMQLNTMGGLGAEALKAGVDVRNPQAWRSQVDYGMDVVKKDGWRQWYGARDIGVSRWEGIGQGASPATAAVTPPPAVAPAATAPQLQNLDASLQSINSSATTATAGVGSLASNLTALPGPLAQTSQGATQLAGSLGSGGGGGLLGALAGLFGGTSSAPAAAPAITAATGGHIRGPGTGTSDSINARLSDGEFVVNARATSQNLSLLHAINDNRPLPAFAEGGLYGTAVPPAAAYQAERERRGEPVMGAATGGGAGQEVHIHGAGAPRSQKRSRRSDGGERVDLLFGSMNAAEIGTPGSPTAKALEQHYGLSRRMVVG